MGRMPRPPRLSPDEVADALSALPAWSGDTDGIERTAELPSFQSAIDAIVAIAAVAEGMGHHPDIDLRWRTLRIAIVTHAAGGVTALDPELARRVDDVLAAPDTPSA
jgi:4a-hydroxytetrahydrobiopterin dehydratase